MNLYQITTTSVGESYVRAYAWAKNVEEAKDLFRLGNPKYADRIQEIHLLMYGTTQHSFCTKASDSGWEV